MPPDAGTIVLDTGDDHAMGHNELPIAEATKGRDRDKVVASAKYRALRGPNGGSRG